MITGPEPALTSAVPSQQERSPYQAALDGSLGCGCHWSPPLLLFSR